MKFLNEYEYKIPKIWFYEIKGVQDVATVREIEIVKKLSHSRAKIFLETRAYLRKSLAALFDLDPLKVPIKANPGEPPELPHGMGNISLSHCKDAIVIVWHKDRVGIDIERQDRIFSHKKFAEKYFFNTHKSNYEDALTKNKILNQWCTVEAAIKWDHGTIAKDIKYWEYFEAHKYLIHKKKKLQLKFSQINFDQWIIALAYKENTSLDTEIICSSKNF